MIAVDIPGFARLELAHLVLDCNGTLAMDGRIIPGVPQRIEALSKKLDIYVLTADTYGSAADLTADWDCTLSVVDGAAHGGSEAEAKRSFVAALGPSATAYVGNGRNDCPAMHDAALGIGVIQSEGAAACLFTAADILLPDIHTALDLLLKPRRLVATLRG